MGRPSTYALSVVEDICARLATGEPLAVICRDEGMPGDSTVYDWEEAHEGVSGLIARAREAGLHAIAWRARRTARGKSQEEGGDSTGDVQRDKLIIETDLKLLAKWGPRLYGDKILHADADGEKLAPATVLFAPVASKRDDASG